MLDILVTFNTGAYKKGKLVMKRKKAVLIYLKSWFLLDFIAAFPYDWAISGQISLQSSDSEGAT